MQKLALHQETLRIMNEQNDQKPAISQACNTKFLSCPECNPPRK